MAGPEVHTGRTKVTKVELSEDDLTLLADGGLEVLHALIGNPATIRQLAIRFRLGRARAKYLVDRLMEQGLVAVYEEAREPGRVETYYAATVQDVALSVSPESGRAREATQFIIDALQRDARRALSTPDPSSPVVLKLVQVHMRPEMARSFADRLRQLAAEFNAAEEEGVLESFALVFALYPVRTEGGSDGGGHRLG